MVHFEMEKTLRQEKKYMEQEIVLASLQDGQIAVLNKPVCKLTVMKKNLTCVLYVQFFFCCAQLGEN